MWLLVVWLAAFFQFIDQVLEMRRRAGRLRTQHLLQTFAHSVADRPARFVIERFGAFVCVRSFHGDFRALMFCSGDGIPSLRSRICFRCAGEFLADLANIR